MQHVSSLASSQNLNPPALAIDRKRINMMSILYASMLSNILCLIYKGNIYYCARRCLLYISKSSLYFLVSYTVLKKLLKIYSETLKIYRAVFLLVLLGQGLFMNGGCPHLYTWKTGLIPSSALVNCTLGIEH